MWQELSGAEKSAGAKGGRKLNREEISHSQSKSSGDGDKVWSSGSLPRSETWSGNTGIRGGEKAKGQMKNKTRRKKKIGKEEEMTRKGKKNE